MPTVLILDDELSIRQLLSDVLEDAGYETLLASNGREGLEILRTILVDLALCDLMMPVLDGAGFIETMRAQPQTRAIPVILMSAAPAAGTAAEQSGVTFLPKPFTLPALLALVEHVLAERAGPAIHLDQPGAGPALSA